MEDFWSYHVEWFGGAWRFHPLLLALNALLLLHFAWDSYRTYQRTGWRIDYWMVIIGIQFVFPVLLLYPYHGSHENYVSIGQRYLHFDQWVSYAHLVTVLGYVTLYGGRALY
ncbi:MAG: hypothetical protein WBA12_05245, partial [Catalinimonas sp.]